MAPARHTVPIRRPVDDLFAVLTNVELIGRWYSAKVEEERWRTMPWSRRMTHPDWLP